MADILPGSRNQPTEPASEAEAVDLPRANVSFRFGEFEALPDTGLLLRNGRRVRIQDLPFRMLIVLLGSPGEIVTREELRNRLWGEKVFVEFDSNLRVAAAKLREALRDNAVEPLYLETISRRGYRFLAPVETITLAEPPLSQPLNGIPEDPAATDLAPDPREPRASSSIPSHRLSLMILGTIALLALMVGLAWRWAHRPLLTAGERIAVGSIRNETGEASLNDALSLAFRIKMEESPFLHVVSKEQFQRAAVALETDQVRKLSVPAAELAACTTSGSKLLLDGRLLRSTSSFTVRLSAERCTDGHEIASTEAQADNPEALLHALGDAADAIRLRLGEPPSMLGRFNVPLTQATTNSLAALRAFREGEQKHLSGRDLDAREDYKLAIDLDPNFALAYLQLGRSYSNTGEVSLSRTYYQKAFDLRERTTDREKLYIATSYYSYATGEVDRAIGAYELWSSLYPNDVIPANNLATQYLSIGEGDKAVAAARHAIALEPTLSAPYAVLADALLITGDHRTLSTLCHDTQRAATAAMEYHLACYQLALLQHDTARKQAEEELAHGKPLEALLLNDGAEGEAYIGHLKTAAKMFEDAVTAARAHSLPELAAIVELNGAAINGELGDIAKAPKAIEDALAHVQPGADVNASASMLWAMFGNEANARELAKAANALEPNDTLLNKAELPVVYAIAALHENHPREAVDDLAPAKPYDLNNSMELMSIYYRGRALLASGDHKEAAAEFERLVAHANERPRSVYIPLSQLELAKLYAAEGQTARAQAMDATLEQTWNTADANFAPLHELRTVFPLKAH